MCSCVVDDSLRSILDEELEEGQGLVSVASRGRAYFVDLPPFTSFLLHESGVDGRHDLVELRTFISTPCNFANKLSHKFCVLYC